jgi:hypothetical protein
VAAGDGGEAIGQPLQFINGREGGGCIPGDGGQASGDYGSQAGAHSIGAANVCDRLKVGRRDQPADV